MNSDFIERYLANRLTQEERNEFELRMKEDTQLKLEVQECQKVIEALKAFDRATLKERLKKRELKLSQIGTSNKWSNRKLYILVGLILSLLLAYIYISSPIALTNMPMQKPLPNLDSSIRTNPKLFQKDSTQNGKQLSPYEEKSNNKINERKNEEIFAANFVPYKDELLESSIRGEEEKTSFEEFQLFYAQRNYPEALKIFESLDPILKNNDNVLFLKANALMAIHKVEKASIIFENIIKNRNSRYIKESYWYIALCSINKGDILSAKKYLSNDLLKDFMPARELLKKL